MIKKCPNSRCGAAHLAPKMMVKVSETRLELGTTCMWCNTPMLWVRETVDKMLFLYLILFPVGRVCAQSSFCAPPVQKKVAAATA